MDEKAKQIVKDNIFSVYGGADNTPSFNIFIVWKCKTIQNYKYLIGSSLPDHLYYELTYNGDKKEWYLDVYNKVQKKVIKEN
jgi:hypothetical protein